MTKCRNADYYKAIFPPRCNAGHGCAACNAKWNRTAQTFPVARLLRVVTDHELRLDR